MNFRSRVAEATRRSGRLCAGIAPSSKWLSRWSLPDDLTGAAEFSTRVLDAVIGQVSIVKIQEVFFQRFGVEGRALQDNLVVTLRNTGTIVVLDTKTSDVADTMVAHAQAVFGDPESPASADATTVVPYLGLVEIVPLARWLATSQRGCLVLVRTSNHRSESIQCARGQEGRAIASELAAGVRELALGRCDTAPGTVGALLGARAREGDELAEELQGVAVEIPGLGRADRNPAEIRRYAETIGEAAFCPITTGYLQCGPAPEAMAESLRRWTEELGQH